MWESLLRLLVGVEIVGPIGPAVRAVVAVDAVADDGGLRLILGVDREYRQARVSGLLGAVACPLSLWFAALTAPATLTIAERPIGSND